MRYYLWNGGTHYGPSSPWERHNDRGDPSSNTKQSSELEDPGRAPWHQPNDCRQMEEAGYHRRSPEGAESTAFHGALGPGRGDRRRLRKHTLLPLDDCLYALQPTIPHLTRSSLHRCLQRHGISRLPEATGDKPAKKKFKSYPIGYFHIDIAEVHTEEGRHDLLVAIDRTSKFAFVEGSHPLRVHLQNLA